MATQPRLNLSTAPLETARITFHTNDDDKDHDTHVTVTVRDHDGDVVARVSDDFGHFPDHSDNGPFNLQIEDPSSQTALKQGSVTIRVDPVGNDTWKFNFFLELIFSDDSRLSASADGLELTDERQEQAFGIQ